jgi:hypothetical protein
MTWEAPIGGCWFRAVMDQRFLPRSGQAERGVVPPEPPRRRAAGVWGRSPHQSSSFQAHAVFGDFFQKAARRSVASLACKAPISWRPQ